MCRLPIHAYTVSLLTPRYSAISSTDNQRLGITLSSIASRRTNRQCTNHCTDSCHLEWYGTSLHWIRLVWSGFVGLCEARQKEPGLD